PGSPAPTMGPGTAGGTNVAIGKKVDWKPLSTKESSRPFGCTKSYLISECTLSKIRIRPSPEHSVVTPGLQNIKIDAFVDGFGNGKNLMSMSVANNGEI